MANVCVHDVKKKNQEEVLYWPLLYHPKYRTNFVAKTECFVFKRPQYTAKNPAFTRSLCSGIVYCRGPGAVGCSVTEGAVTTPGRSLLAQRGNRFAFLFVPDRFVALLMGDPRGIRVRHVMVFITLAATPLI